MKMKKILGTMIAVFGLAAVVSCSSDPEDPKVPDTSDTEGNEDSGNEGSGNEGSGNEGSGNEGSGNEGSGNQGDVVQENDIEMNGVAYETLAAAFAAIPTSGDTSTYTIKLNKGTYNVSYLNYNGSATIRIIGNTETKYGTDVIITGHGTNMSSMRGREMIEIQGTGDIILENVSLVSDYSREGLTTDAQAEVLGTDTKGNTVAYNCSFKSHQDTVRTCGKAWFYGCYVEGDTDFIWMETAGSVALYENCEIVSIYDEFAKTHASYVAAPRMAISSKVGKGLVFYNSTIKESDEAKANGQQTYLARSPWTSGYYSQVSYINSTISDIETDIWKGSAISTDYPENIIGFKMDSFSAESLGISGKNYIIDDETVEVEYNGRDAILNRIYNTGKLKYEKDTNYWDIAAVIEQYGYNVTTDNSSALLEGEVEANVITYTFDGSTDYSDMCNGFQLQANKTHYYGQNGSTITVPVEGKSYITVYGYYSGSASIKADTENGYGLMFFNNNSTSSTIEYHYIVTDENATSAVITALSTTYITKIEVEADNNIATPTLVSDIDITKSSTIDIVGVGTTLTASCNKDATNKTVIWSSSDEAIATIDKYTGKINFIAEGEVTFTATACDGSNVCDTITCNPIASNWDKVEFYTTDNKLDTDDGAQGYEYWTVNSSAYKNLGTSYSFTNLANETITTSNGLKLNSAGKLSIAVTKKATLTVVTCDCGKVFATPVVQTKDANGNTINAVLESTNIDSTGKIYTYVYTLTCAGLWDITRGDTSSENNALLYAKCEYPEAIVSSSKGITFKGTYYTESNTGIANDDIIYPTDLIDASSADVTFEEFTFSGCKSNNSVTNWLTFKNNATITFKVSGPCTLLIGYYSKLQTVTLDDVVLNGDKDSVSSNGEIVSYEVTAAGTITITATEADYLGFIGVVFAE